MTTSTSLSMDEAGLWHETRPLFSPLSYQGRTRRPRRRVYYLWHRGALSEPSRSRAKRVFDAAQPAILGRNLELTNRWE